MNCSMFISYYAEHENKRARTILNIKVYYVIKNKLQKNTQSMITICVKFKSSEMILFIP